MIGIVSLLLLMAYGVARRGSLENDFVWCLILCFDEVYRFGILCFV